MQSITEHFMNVGVIKDFRGTKKSYITSFLSKEAIVELLAMQKISPNSQFGEAATYEKVEIFLKRTNK